MTPNEFFDEIFVINLDRRADRRQQISASLDELGIKATRIPAIDGQAIGITGVTASRMSHLIPLLIAKDKHLGRILVLEDDAIFSHDFLDGFADVIDNLPPSWDMFYLGANTGSITPTDNPRLWKTSGAVAIHAIAYNNRVFDNCIDIATTTTAVLDLAYYWEHPALEAYIVRPYLVTQSDGHSDLLNVEVNYSDIIQ